MSNTDRPMAARPIAARSRRGAAAALLLAASGGGVALLAQESAVFLQQAPVHAQAGTVTMTRAVPGVAAMPFELDLKPVADAPFTAEASTEMVQTLADGNRIVQRHSSSLARDGQGRTRRDQVLAAIGSVAPEQQPRTVFINDPIAHVSYVLDPQQQTAFKREGAGGPAIAFHAGSVVETYAGAGGEIGAVTSARLGPMRREHAEKVFEGKPGEVEAVAGKFEHAGPSVTIMAKPHGSLAKPETESLGTQNIEGVEATGTRTTVTIAAGEIGNEQPIKIVSERWYSPELQLVVLSTRSDPRMGETTYRVTNIARGDPSPALFEVPAGYTMVDKVLPRKIAPPPPPPPPPGLP